MGKVGEEKPVTKMVIVIDGIDYVIAGSGGTPGPNTVGTDQIIDGAVEEEDLHDDVKDRMTVTHDSSTGGLRLGGYAKSGDVPVNSGGQGGFPNEMEVEEGD